MELSYLEVLKTIKNFAEENNLEITANDINEINSVYNSLKNEKINMNKNKFETQSLITMIAQDVISGAYNRKKTMLQHSDFRHMGYFDRWFKEGVSEDITNILNSYGIPTDVFKGIPRLQNFQNEQYINGHSLEIIQTADSESPPNANIILRVDGQVVDLSYEVNEKVASSYNYWLSMGSPDRLSKEEKEIIHKASYPKIEFKYFNVSSVFSMLCPVYFI